MKELQKNCPIKVHRLFTTLTKLLTNSMATENCEISENSVEIYDYNHAYSESKTKINQKKSMAQLH